MTRYDLHSHSDFSDGVLPPHAVVARAKLRGVDVLALTDHDSIAGLDSACDAAREHGMTLIPGVEISVTWEKHLVHILGLCVDRANATLLQGLAQLQAIREQRAQQMAQRLEKHGVRDALAGALKHAPNGLVTRRHFALHMVEAGIAPTLPKIFERYLRAGKPGYVSTQWAELDATVDWINAAGGVAVIAHPQRYEMSATTRRRLVEQFSAHGGAGIEVVCGGSGQDAVHSSAALAQRFGLLASVGSDFHDPASGWNELGKLAALPPDSQPIWSHERFRY